MRHTWLVPLLLIVVVVALVALIVGILLVCYWMITRESRYVEGDYLPKPVYTSHAGKTGSTIFRWWRS